MKREAAEESASPGAPGPEVGQSAVTLYPDLHPQRKKIGVPYSKPITDLLTHWLLSHANHPYPTEEEKHELCRQTQLSLNQLNNWFTNARRRNKILIATHAQHKKMQAGFHTMFSSQP